MTTAELLQDHGAAIANMLAREYGLTGELHALPGEVDANLKLRSPEASFLVKIAGAGGSPADVELQIAALEHLEKTDVGVALPAVRRTLSDRAHTQLSLAGELPRTVWLSTWLEGRTIASRGFVNAALCTDLGRAVAKIDIALATFEHPRAHRSSFKWDLCQADWIGEHLDGIADRDVRAAVATVYDNYRTRMQPLLPSLPRSIVHNDANDHNVLCGGNNAACVTGIFDFGDMCETVRVADLAIAAAYAAMASPDALAGIDAITHGYHSELPLSEAEREALLPLLQTRLAVSITNAAVQQRLRPDDDYIQISQRHAKRVLLELHGRHADVARHRIAQTCGIAPAPLPQRVAAYLAAETTQVHAVLADHQLHEAPVLDLSFESIVSGDNPLEFDAHQAGLRIHDAMRVADSNCAVGRYAEPRPLYTSRAFGAETPNSPRRTVHLGIDVFAPAGATVQAPLAGRVVDARICPDRLDYGGLVILAHPLPDPDPGHAHSQANEFCTLYGHLSHQSVAKLRIGQELAAGEAFAQLGDAAENGGWPPHLHLQALAHGADRLEGVPQGVADPDDLPAHLAIYPNPARLLGVAPDRVRWHDPSDDLATARESRFASNLKTSYSRPLSLVRGMRHVLLDRFGRRYLDAYNNVPHVGHCHPRVVEAVQQQTALLATNTRYLHQGMHDYAERLRALLPTELTKFFFTPSGSEANELALRLARAHTGHRDVCVMDHGYHGHTTSTMAMSPYKFRQEGAAPKPDWVHVTPQPDVYRGAHRGEDAGELYAEEVRGIVQSLQQSNRTLAAYICECLPSVGGQMELPTEFLAQTYAAVRKAGGLCIADDVQTGLWRTGDRAFGFERHHVVPDILVLGKPLGNGFPLGAVATTSAIAQSFAKGPEFFSTFGGSTVAMAAGLAVLDVLRDEPLADNARRTGDRLLKGLRELQTQHECIGDVRGRGFFLGVDLVSDRESRTPNTELAGAIKNRLRDRRVLIGTDGPHDNVLKIRPPMTFDAAAADCLLDELDRALRT
ncbi:MAG: aminotransferase class III-fold pyridoxal phosphate-dependent enzyme [Planctomycetota bacterium]